MLPPTSALTAEIITLRAIALKLKVLCVRSLLISAEIITLRAIALKLDFNRTLRKVDAAAEIITLRAIALKRCRRGVLPRRDVVSRDHNATRYNAENTDSTNITIQGIAAISP